ncbi:MAG: NAD(P)H-dependent oxidoreductase subunit E [Acidimicrobiaceae bacterium]|nr:NAD(P)H-dependent oxidoreductase subunit E [Acidimicrobiaceae bacterium]
MARLTPENEQRVRELFPLYPHHRSALIPALHILQEQDGYLTEEGMEHLGELFDLSAAEVRGTASFYDMFHTEPVGKYLLAVCTNIACLLQGAYELLDHVEERLGVAPGGTTTDGLFTLEDAECLALCGNAPCVTVNWRFFGDVSPESFDRLVEDLAAGRLEEEVPPHGTLSRVPRNGGLRAAGHSVNGFGGPPSTWGAGEDEPAPEEGAAPPPPVRLETRFSTTAVVSLDGGRARQELGPQTPLRELEPEETKDGSQTKDTETKDTETKDTETKDTQPEAGSS